MTDQPKPVTSTPVTRRRLLRLSGLAAAGGTAAALTNTSPAGAAGAVVLGSNANVATTPTGIAVTGTSAGYGLGVVDNGLSTLAGKKPSLLAHATGQNFREAIFALAEGTATALRAQSSRTGIDAQSTFDVAVAARSTNSYAIAASGPAGGVRADSTWGSAVLGLAIDGVGVVGSSVRNNGVRGGSDSSAGVFGFSQTAAGVRAENQGATGPGLEARTTSSSNAAPAVLAEARGTGPGLRAINSSSATYAAIEATSASPVPAVRARGTTVPAAPGIPLAGHGTALSVEGGATFTRSGVATISAGTSSVTVLVPGGLQPTSHVLATLQTNAPGVLLRAAVPNVSTGRVTVNLNGAAPVGGIVVAWFVFG